MVVVSWEQYKRIQKGVETMILVCPKCKENLTKFTTEEARIWSQFSRFKVGELFCHKCAKYKPSK